MKQSELCNLAAAVARPRRRAGRWPGSWLPRATISSMPSRSATATRRRSCSNDPADGIVNARDGNGDTALIIAITGATRNGPDSCSTRAPTPILAGKGGDTPLIAAARVGFEEAVEWLLGLGAKVDATNRMGETPLIIAVQQRQMPIVRDSARRMAPIPTRRIQPRAIRRAIMPRATTRSREILQLIEAKKPKAAPPPLGQLRRATDRPAPTAAARRGARNRSSSALRRAGASGRCAASRMIAAS